jgi:signal recognition particle receptor subunit beta
MRILPRNAIADRTVPYDDAKLYDVPGHECPHRTRERALDAAESLLALVASGKLDRTDLRIIEERSRSPMPTMREVGAIVGIDAAAVQRRVNKVRSMLMRTKRSFPGYEVNKTRL